MAEGGTKSKFVLDSNMLPESGDVEADRENDDDVDDDEFEDAMDTPTAINDSVTKNLHSIIADATSSMDLFINSKFQESKELYSRYAEHTIYHALGYGTCMYLEAAMTFEPASIAAAVETVRKSVQVCNRQRKHASFLGSVINRYNQSYYDSLTVEQIHAELCYAECLIESAFLNFIQDENLISFIRGGLKIKSCYNSYTECVRILRKRNWKDGDERAQFESGVAMGVGLFNLMVSMLPKRVMKVLEFVGFSGDKARGLRELEKGALLTNTMRGPMCALALIGYHTYLTFMLGSGDGDVDLAARILKLYAEKYPTATFFLFYAGRIEQVKGHIEEAILKYEESVASQDQWKQFHHPCYWELMWCHCYTADWLLAMKYAEKLLNESKWSRSTYAYHKATFMLMMPDLTAEAKRHISELMEQVPKMKQRLAGKSLPIEKFAVKKSQRYFAQSGRLALAAHELDYIWSGLSIVGKRKELLDIVLSDIAKCLEELEHDKDKLVHYADDYCLALLLKGVCLRQMNEVKEAEACFLEIVSLEKKITEDLYILVSALYEHAILLISQTRLQEARDRLRRAKHNYKGYSLESRIHFRLHAASCQLKSLGLSSSDSDIAVQNDDLNGTLTA